MKYQELLSMTMHDEDDVNIDALQIVLYEMLLDGCHWVRLLLLP